MTLGVAINLTGGCATVGRCDARSPGTGGSFALRRLALSIPFHAIRRGMVRSPPPRLKPWTSPGEASPWSDPPWPATDPPRLCWRVCAARLERAARFVAGPSKQPMQLRRARLALEHLRLHPECLGRLLCGTQMVEALLISRRWTSSAHVGQRSTLFARRQPCPTAGD